MPYDTKKNTIACLKYRKNHPEKYRETQRNAPCTKSEYRTKKRLENIEKNLKKEREYRDKNRSHINDLMNQRRKILKQQCLDYLGGAKCSKCGYTNENIAPFEFHHKNPKEKIFTISNAISLGKPFEEIMPELTKCEVLCRNCHGIKHSS